MHRAEVEALREAASAAWRIFLRVAPVLRALPDSALAAIGVPAAARAICRRYDPTLGESVIVRFDIALTADGPKILELNAETPFFLWESYEIAGATAAAFGEADPNAGQLERLTAAVRHAIGDAADVRVAVAAFNTWREDWFSAVFAARVASEATGRSVQAIPLHELRIAGGALRDGDGRTIDVLWRLYPLEHFATDPGGRALFELVQRGALRLINPPSALLLQNKAVLAIIWELAQRGVHFDASERATIARYFLPAFLDPPDGGETFVRKPVYGREGNSVGIVRGGKVLATSARQHYRDQPMLYQRFVTLPQTHGGTAVATCFVVGGEPGAIGMRIGNTITGIDAKFIAIGQFA